MSTVQQAVQSNNEVEVVIPTEHELVSRLEAIYAEINVLKEDITSIKGLAKKYKYDPKTLNKVAKLRSSCKVGEFIVENSSLINFIREKGL